MSKSTESASNLSNNCNKTSTSSYSPPEEPRSGAPQPSCKTPNSIEPNLNLNGILVAGPLNNNNNNLSLNNIKPRQTNICLDRILDADGEERAPGRRNWKRRKSPAKSLSKSPKQNTKSGSSPQKGKKKNFTVGSAPEFHSDNRIHLRKQKEELKNGHLDSNSNGD